MINLFENFRSVVNESKAKSSKETDLNSNSPDLPTSNLVTLPFPVGAPSVAPACTEQVQLPQEPSAGIQLVSEQKRKVEIKSRPPETNPEKRPRKKSVELSVDVADVSMESPGKWIKAIILFTL